MDDDGLAGTRLLVIGGNREEAESLRAQLAAAGSEAVELVPALDQVAARAAAARSQLVLALEDSDPASVRARLDPLGLDAGPPVVALSELRLDGRPLDAAAVSRLRLVLEHCELRRRANALERLVASHALRASRDAEALQADALGRLALAAAYRDDNSPEHAQRVGELAARLARELGEPDGFVAAVREAAPLHDLGKIAIPDSILLKPGRLEPEEFEVVKTHAALGARVLAGGASELFAVAERIARSHHERWDGGGYPDGLAGGEIPLAARLAHAADVFDVLVHERPYKEAWTVEAAAREISSAAGTQFDPRVVAAFEALEPPAGRPSG